MILGYFVFSYYIIGFFIGFWVWYEVLMRFGLDMDGNLYGGFLLRMYRLVGGYIEGLDEGEINWFVIIIFWFVNKWKSIN